MKPFRAVADILDRIDELQQLALAIYVLVVLLAGIALNSYDSILSILTHLSISLIMSIPGSILIRFLLEALMVICDAITPDG